MPDSPYTITYAYTTDGTFASASATSTLTVNPILITLTVNSLGDAGIGSGDAGDLRYCIDQANADGQSNTIVFDPTVFGTPQTITLSGGELELENIWGTQTITGPAAGLTISGGGSSRVFQVDPGVTASISGLTISGGYDYSLGGGLANYGTTTLTDCTISGNGANYGGGMFNDGTANISDCTLSGNISDGLANIGSATLIGCTITGNERGVVNARTPYQNTADLVLINCTVNGNYGRRGSQLGPAVPDQLHHQRQFGLLRRRRPGQLRGPGHPDRLHHHRQLRRRGLEHGQPGHVRLHPQRQLGPRRRRPVQWRLGDADRLHTQRQRRHPRRR